MCVVAVSIHKSIRRAGSALNGGVDEPRLPSIEVIQILNNYFQYL